MLTGIITLVLFLVTAYRFFFNLVKKNKRKSYSLNKLSNTNLSLKIHKATGLLLTATVFIHLIIVLKLSKQRPIGMFITGFIMLLLCFIEILSYFLRNNFKNKWNKIHKYSAVIIFLCIIIHITFGVNSLNEYKSLVSEINIPDIELSGLKDGDYTGEYDAGYVYARVKVTIKNGTIYSIDLLEHRTEKGQRAEIIPSKIVEAQKINVDTISGATNSSKVIEKAVYNALK